MHHLFEFQRWRQKSNAVKPRNSPVATEGPIGVHHLMAHFERQLMGKVVSDLNRSTRHGSDNEDLTHVCPGDGRAELEQAESRRFDNVRPLQLQKEARNVQDVRNQDDWKHRDERMILERLPRRFFFLLLLLSWLVVVLRLRVVARRRGRFPLSSSFSNLTSHFLLYNKN